MDYSTVAPQLEKVGQSAGTDPIRIDGAEFSASQFMMPSHYSEYVDRIVIPHGMIEDRVEKLASIIKDYFQNEELHIICILKGSRGFFNMLLNFLNKMHIYSPMKFSKPPFLEHYIRVKSYLNFTTDPNNELEIISDDLSCLRGKNVLIIEDIIDTGNTLSHLCNWMQKLQPKQIRIAALLSKRRQPSSPIAGDFVGFSVPDEFLVGFSLDYNEIFRDLEHIGILNTKGREKFATTK